MTQTDYANFDTKHHRLLQQEELIIEVTEALSRALMQSEMKKSDLAARLNVTKGFVSQIFGGGKNLTLRTLADVADALGFNVRVGLTPRAIAYRLTDWKVQCGGKVLPMVSSGPARENGTVPPATSMAS